MDVLNKLLQETTPIYNRYLSGDFQVGADNLNPKRELQQDTLQNIDDARLALFLKYKEQFIAVLGDNSIAAPSDLGIPYVNRIAVSSPVSVREGFPPAAASVPIEHDLYNILKAITGFLGGTPVTLSDLPFDICSDFPHPAGIEPNPPGTSSSSPGGSVITSGLSGSNTNGSDAASKGNPSASDIVCAHIELGLLQIIFQIIKWIKQAIALEKWAIAYVYPYIQLAQQIAACYLNPAMLQQVILSLAGQGTAILIGIITDLVSQFLASLNLECLLSEMMSVVQQILGSINGVGDLGSALGSFVNFNAKGIAGGLEGAGMVYNAAQGNNAALAAALGIPPDQPTSLEALASNNSGNLFDLAMKSGMGTFNSIKNTAIGNAAAVAGTAVSAYENLIKKVNTASNDITGSAKLIKDYFPGGQFSTF